MAPRTSRKAKGLAKSDFGKISGAFLDSAHLVGVFLDPEWKITSLNRVGGKVVGCSPQEAVGRSWVEHFVPPERRSRVLKVLEAAKGGEGGGSWQSEVLRKDDERRRLAWTASPVSDGSGKVVGVVVIGIEVAGDDSYQEDLRRKERFLAALLGTADEAIRGKESQIWASLDSVADGFIAIDEDGVVESFNRAAETMFGYSAEEVIGQKVRMLMPGPYRSEGDGSIGDDLRTGEAKIIEIGRAVEGRRKDGTTFPLSLAVGEIRLGERRLFVANLRKVSRERELQLAVQSPSQLMAAIVQASTDAILAMDPEGRVLSWNPGAEAVLGYSAEEVLGRHYRLLIPSDLQQGGEEERLERMFREQGYIRNYLTRRRRRGGQEVQVMLSRTALRNHDGELIGFSSILRDVTQENRLREQLYQSEKFSAIGELATGIAHEIGGPLSVISGNAEFLRESLDAADPRRADVEGIVKECDAVARLVRRLLDFSKPARLEAKPVDLNECLRNVLLLVRKPVAKGRIEIKLNLQVGLPPVLGDANQLEQVFMNLLLNAWHAMPEGGRLDIRSFASRSRGGNVPSTVGVEMTDTGVGIPEANVGRIFDPFFTTRPREEGTGLGLAITRRIVTEHGGTISVRSREGEGTTFIVELPVSLEGSG